MSKYHPVWKYGLYVTLYFWTGGQKNIKQLIWQHFLYFVDLKLLVKNQYLCDSEDTTTTRAGAERRRTSCRPWTSRKWPKWQIWKVDSRPSSVKFQGWVQTAALQTRMCRGLREEGVKTHLTGYWLKTEEKNHFKLEFFSWKGGNKRTVKRNERRKHCWEVKAREQEVVSDSRRWKAPGVHGDAASIKL